MTSDALRKDSIETKRFNWAADEIDRLSKLLHREATDWAETVTHIRNAAKRVLPAAFVDGDAVSVTPVEDIVDRLVERVAALERCGAKIDCSRETCERCGSSEPGEWR